MTPELSTQITAFGQKLLQIEDIDEALSMIAEEAKSILGAERCTLFLVDTSAQMLWSKLSDGIGRIAIGLDSGVAGETYQSQKPQMVNKPYEDEHFMSKIDAQSGFVTRNILTTPIFGSTRDVIGVIQLLNKKESDFTEEDADTLRFFANYVSGTLELILMTKS